MLEFISQYKELAIGTSTTVAGAIMFLKYRMEQLEKHFKSEIKEIKNYVDLRHTEIKDDVREIKDMVRSGFDKVDNRLYDLNKKGNDAQK